MKPPAKFNAIEAGWSLDDWEIAREEMAAVLEYDQGLSRSRAEQIASAQARAFYGTAPRSLDELEAENLRYGKLPPP